MEVLRRAGRGRAGALAGAALEARLRRLPLVLDGFVVTAAVAPLELLHPAALANAVAGHRSAEPGHTALLERLGKQPLLDLGMRLGEGSGALAPCPSCAWPPPPSPRSPPSPNGAWNPGEGPAQRQCRS